MELEREGTTYTKDTLSALKQLYPKDKFYFIVGGDSLASMEMWYEPAYIFKNCRILAANRDETDGRQIRKLKTRYEKNYGAEISEIKTGSCVFGVHPIQWSFFSYEADSSKV